MSNLAVVYQIRGVPKSEFFECAFGPLSFSPTLFPSFFPLLSPSGPAHSTLEGKGKLISRELEGKIVLQ